MKRSSGPPRGSEDVQRKAPLDFCWIVSDRTEQDDEVYGECFWVTAWCWRRMGLWSMARLEARSAQSAEWLRQKHNIDI